MQLRPRNHPPSASTLSDYFASSRPQSKKRKVEKDSNHQDHSKPPKRTRYIHAPGKTPFPEWSHPTPEECLEVRNLLESVHGESIRPTDLVVNNTVAGCGEVPSVLDALMRTILSANTSNSNSARAFQGLIDRFGLISDKPPCNANCNDSVEGEVDSDLDDNSDDFNNSGFFTGESEKRRSTSNPQPNSTLSKKAAPAMGLKARNSGVGSINWDLVRRSPTQALFDAIKSGGLAKIKSTCMKTILDEVWEEGKERKRQARAAAGKPPVEPENEDGELTLDYLHDLDDEAAKAKLTSYKGVGFKTASCVLLFCLRRESFAVDTHIFRLTKFLGWVPENATRDTAAFHLDTRIPDELKYPIHCLLVKHGRTCSHCKANRKESGSVKKIAGTRRAKVEEEEEDTNPGDSTGPAIPMLKRTSERIKVEAEVPKVKRMKKIWVGNGSMKEVVVEVDTEDEGGDLEKETCVLEHLVKRVRK